MNPAYNSEAPPSRAMRRKPGTRPEAYVLSETSRIRVASRGVRRMSAKNSAILHRDIVRLEIDRRRGDERGSEEVDGGTMRDRSFWSSYNLHQLGLPELYSLPISTSSSKFV
jgi:hypothetical protein